MEHTAISRHVITCANAHVACRTFSPGYRLNKLLNGNLRLFGQSDRRALRVLAQSGDKQYLLQNWPVPGHNDAAKRSLVTAASGADSEPAELEHLRLGAWRRAGGGCLLLPFVLSSAGGGDDADAPSQSSLTSRQWGLAPTPSARVPPPPTHDSRAGGSCCGPEPSHPGAARRRSQRRLLLAAGRRPRRPRRAGAPGCGERVCQGGAGRHRGGAGPAVPRDAGPDPGGRRERAGPGRALHVLQPHAGGRAVLGALPAALVPGRPGAQALRWVARVGVGVPTGGGGGRIRCMRRIQARDPRSPTPGCVHVGQPPTRRRHGRLGERWSGSHVRPRASPVPTNRPAPETDQLDVAVPEQVLLDENEEAKHHKFYMVGGFEVSPNHKCARVHVGGGRGRGS